MFCLRVRRLERGGPRAPLSYELPPRDGVWMASRVVRLGVSLEPELLTALDRWSASRNSSSRSDAIRALIRREMAEENLVDPMADAVAAVTVLYRHTDFGVQRRLTASQHRWGGHIISSTHFHLQGDACLEVLVLEGKRAELVQAAEDLRGVRGVIHGDYLLTSPHVAGGRTGHEHPHPTHAHGSRSRRSGEAAHR